MSMPNSLLVALIIMSIVSGSLVALFFLLKVQASIIAFVESNKKSQQIKEEVMTNVDSSENIVEKSNGKLKLIGVDEKTTAMIMAILSDELKIPLHEFQFISIKLINS